MNYCPKCGAPNPDHSATCGSCGALLANPFASSSSGAPIPINNYLIPAILATLCCCPPFGIVSIVYAAQVNSRLAAADIAGALKAATLAKRWFWVAIASGLLAQILYLLGVIALALAANLGPNP